MVRTPRERSIGELIREKSSTVSLITNHLAPITKQATTLTFNESIFYSVSRLEKYWARSGSFYLLPNLYDDPSKLMLVMLSERFKADLLPQEPSWSLFTDLSEKHSRKTAA